MLTRGSTSDDDISAGLVSVVNVPVEILYAHLYGFNSHNRVPGFPCFPWNITFASFEKIFLGSSGFHKILFAFSLLELSRAENTKRAVDYSTEYHPTSTNNTAKKTYFPKVKQNCNYSVTKADILDLILNWILNCHFPCFQTLRPSWAPQPRSEACVTVFDNLI